MKDFNTIFRFIPLLMFCLGMTSLQGQDREVSGKVSDREGSPLPGATVQLKGTINGTTTDFDGNYAISVMLIIN